MEIGKNTTRRNFLEAMSAAPSLAFLAAGAGQVQAAPAKKFTPVDLSSHFDHSLPALVKFFDESSRDDLARIPTGASNSGYSISPGTGR